MGSSDLPLPGGVPITLGRGVATGTDTVFGTAPGIGVTILTSVDASSLGGVGVSAPICHIDGSYTAASLLRLGGVANDVTLFWEAHWSGEQYLQPGETLSVHNGNPGSGESMDVALTGVWYPAGP